MASWPKWPACFRARNWRWWRTSGSLVQPLTRAQYQAQQAPIPLNLFSHADQQLQWQTSIAQGNSPTGWAGRAADYIASQKINSSNFPAFFSVAGNALEGNGATTQPVALAPGRIAGAGRIQCIGGIAGAFERAQQPADHSNRRVAGAGRQRHAHGEQHERRDGAGGRARQSTPLKTHVSRHLASARSCSRWRRSFRCSRIWGCSRQIFFCSLGGFDTHAGELETHNTLYPQLSPALAAFYAATQELGVAQNVTTFTESDFSRTFQPTTTDGSDHAWGSHHMVLGGAVQGGQIYGPVPDVRAGRAERHRYARPLDSDARRSISTARRFAPGSGFRTARWRPCSRISRISDRRRWGSWDRRSAARKRSAAFDPAPQDFGHAPGLRDASARCEGRFGVENFADGSDASLSQMRLEAVQEFAGAFQIAGMNFEPGIDERPDQPGPHRPLMIGGVAGAEVAVVLRLVVLVIR